MKDGIEVSGGDGAAVGQVTGGVAVEPVEVLPPARSQIDNIPIEKRGLGAGRRKGSRNTGPLGSGGLRRQKDELRKLAYDLAAKDDPKLRKALRRKLEVISLIYAANSLNGDDFRKCSELAVDLSGYRLEIREKVKDKANARRAGAEKSKRVRMVAVEREPEHKETAF